MATGTLEVLVSTMRRDDYGFLDRLSLTTPAIVVNQNGTAGTSDLDIAGNRVRIVCSDTQGLSRSRNIALANATADICAIADDDMRYAPDYAETILGAYEAWPQADIIAFRVGRVGSRYAKVFRDKPHWESYASCLKISSVEITFRRARVIEHGLKFNELLGAGSDFYVGEENVFLYDALRKGLRVLYLPSEIASVDCTESSWFAGYNDSYFNSLGAAFYNMANRLYPALILQFAIRKRGLYGRDVTPRRAISEMFRGVRAYKARSVSGRAGSVR